MASTTWVSLESKVGELAFALISDNGDLASPEDSIRAAAFLILASGAIEQYVEDRCRAAARSGIDRLKKSKPSATGSSLVVWAATKNSNRQTPIHIEDVAEYYDMYDAFLKSYIASVDSSHGIGAKDFHRLVYPVGVRTDDVPPGLPDLLQSLSSDRDPAVHTAPRAKSFQHPPDVKKRVSDIVNQLKVLDEAIGRMEVTFPVRVTAAGVP
ncbi:hypothetical protein EXU48_09965 [Occultella glacieicola]|uniref:RiboL-PSP-HEPN domain-containing protein n=1 Tax=Occultella glacieicola TaxID=2518684 RepID=A0ABY2E9U3_9MICO|nr:hypothetical protein [Occultella glacieicola]TDE95077.1 hypothetical protein EXU48_09965 [Occultella glacieicola]